MEIRYKISSFQEECWTVNGLINDPYNMQNLVSKIRIFFLVYNLKKPSSFFCYCSFFLFMSLRFLLLLCMLLNFYCFHAWDVFFIFRLLLIFPISCQSLKLETITPLMGVASPILPLPRLRLFPFSPTSPSHLFTSPYYWLHGWSS